MNIGKRKMLAERIDSFKDSLNSNEKGTKDIDAFAKMLILTLYGSLEPDLVSIVTDYLTTGEYWDSHTKEVIIYNGLDLIDFVLNY
jgi:hypothetical protein